MRLAALWTAVDAMEPSELLLRVDTLAAERPSGDPAALFERACARDTTGDEQAAEGLYRAALANGGLDHIRRARATIQLASTLRILGRLDESEEMLTAELARQDRSATTHPLHDDTRAILALTYVAQGRGTEATGLALLALAPHLSRYNRSVAGNAAELLEPPG